MEEKIAQAVSTQQLGYDAIGCCFFLHFKQGMNQKHSFFLKNDTI